MQEWGCFCERAGGRGVTAAVDHEVESVYRACDFHEIAAALIYEGAGAAIDFVATWVGEPPVHMGVGVFCDPEGVADIAAEGGFRRAVDAVDAVPVNNGSGA